MMDTAIWSTPECPFTVEYAPGMFDSIRMEVSEAFYSLPRGGAEIGGILLGKWEVGKLTLSGYRQLACEHAFGPSFNLSPGDRLRLTQLIAGASAAGEQVAGWYHSHTRSEVFLSDADLQIHAEFFPEPWQIAMVLRPHTMRPLRAGIFFRDAEGKIHSESALREITLEPPDSAGHAAGAVTGIPGLSPASQVVVDAEPVPAPAPTPAAEPVPPPPQPVTLAAPPVAPEHLPPPFRRTSVEPPAEPVPHFLTQEEKSWPRWPKVAAILVVAAAIGGAAYWKRDLWMSRVLPTSAASSPASPAPATPLLPSQAPASQPPPALGLNTVDLDGQLQIRWDRNSPVIAKASSAVLHIGGPSPMPDIKLDREHLLSGVFTIGRQSERVEVAMDVAMPSGDVREATTYLGPLPAHKPAEAAAASPNPAAAAPSDEMLKEVRRLRSDLDAERAHEARMQKDIDFLAKQFREQRSRLLNQAK